MRPERENIAAPELPGRLRWLNAERAPRMSELTAAGPVLVHFFDYAQLNSVRAMPYVVAWDERYRDLGLTTLGVHTPRFKFSAEREQLQAGVEALRIAHPVADDSRYEVWHDYGCRGWPSLFLWGQGGALRWFHFGEGEYEATESAIQEQLDGEDPLPEPMAPLRDTDAPGALVAPPSEEIFPGGSETEPWQGGPIELDYAAGGAHASVAGAGRMTVSIDGGAARTVEVARAGLVELAAHTKHESHHLRLEPGDSIDLYSISFSPGLP
jgi:hypothetical protein